MYVECRCTCVGTKFNVVKVIRLIDFTYQHLLTILDLFTYSYRDNYDQNVDEHTKTYVFLENNVHIRRRTLVAHT